MMWVVRLTDKQLEVLKALLHTEEQLGPALQRVLAALELARWDELPDAQLPWEEVVKLAAEQHVSEADVVWDLCGRPPVASRRKRRRAAAG